MKGYRTPPNLQVFEFVEVQKQLFVARVERGTGPRRRDCRRSATGSGGNPDRPISDPYSPRAASETGADAPSDTAS